jgi:hypothetical protein
LINKFKEIHMLEIAKFHCGKEKATNYVNYLAKSLGIPIPQGKRYQDDIHVQFGGKPFSCNLGKAVVETQNCGAPDSIHFLLDSKDRYLQPIIYMAIANMPKGLKANLSATLGAYNISIPAPGIIESPEQSLADDILYYRKQTCLNSGEDNLRNCTRFYRGYLQACISLVDCFLFRYTSFVKEKIGDLSEYSNTHVLGSVSGIEKRIEAWFQTFAYHKIDIYKNTGEWSQFQELRAERNKFIHPFEPATIYSFKDMSNKLNYCRKGIGGLLENFRLYSECNPKIGFIQKVKSAPIVSVKK